MESTEITTIAIEAALYALDFKDHPPFFIETSNDENGELTEIRFKNNPEIIGDLDFKIRKHYRKY